MADLDLQNQLFGTDSDSDADGPGPSQPHSEGPAPRSSSNSPDRVPYQPAIRLRDEDDDDENAEAPQKALLERGPPQELRASLMDLPDPNSLRSVRLSNMVGLQPQPFDPDSFEPEGQAHTDERGLKRTRLADENIMRWRWKTLPSGTREKQSNARFVRWSDGSLQLMIGAEVFDVSEHDMALDNHFVFMSHPGGVIQGQAWLRRKMAFRPASLENRSHKRLVGAVDKQKIKAFKVRSYATLSNPDKDKAEREAAEEARIRERESLLRRQDREMKKYPAARREARPLGITAQYLEAMDEEPDYDDDLTATERARSDLAKGRRFDEAAEREAEQRLAAAKRSAGTAPTATIIRNPQGPKRSVALKDDSDADDDVMGDFIVEDDGDIVDTHTAPTSGKRRALVLSDDEEDE